MLRFSYALLATIGLLPIPESRMYSN